MRTITFIRHGKTDKAKPDSARRLTDEGRAQAARRRELMGNPTFDVGFHSPRERTKQTIDIIAGGTIPTTMIPELLHDSETEDGKRLDAAFEKLGYATVKDYFGKSDPDTQSTLKQVGATAWVALMKVVEITAPNARILVVGHAVLLPLMVYMGCDEGYRKAMEQINLGECEGIWISVDDNWAIQEIGTHCN